MFVFNNLDRCQPYCKTEFQLKILIKNFKLVSGFDGLRYEASKLDSYLVHLFTLIFRFYLV